jgi:hypothetical protein
MEKMLRIGFKLSLLFLLIAAIPIIVSAAEQDNTATFFVNCPDNFDEDTETRNLIAFGLFTFLKAPEKSPVTKQMLLDIIIFYYSTGNCYAKGDLSDERIIDIANRIRDIGYVDFMGSCQLGSDIIPDGGCYYQYHCEGGEIKENCSKDCPGYNRPCFLGSCDPETHRCNNTDIYIPDGLIAWWKMDEIEEGMPINKIDNGDFSDGWDGWNEHTDWTIEEETAKISRAQGILDAELETETLDISEGTYTLRFKAKATGSDDPSWLPTVQLSLCYHIVDGPTAQASVELTDTYKTYELYLDCVDGMDRNKLLNLKFNGFSGDGPIEFSIDDIVLYDEVSEIVLDSSGYDHHAELDGDLGIQDGVVGNAADFQGSFLHNDDKIIDEWGEYTITGWFKKPIEDLITQNTLLGTSRDSRTYDTLSIHFDIHERFHFQQGYGIARFGVNLGHERLMDNRWHQFAVTKDDQCNFFLFIDGNILDSGSDNCPTIDYGEGDVPLPEQLGIGALYDGALNPDQTMYWYLYSGLLDEIQIYNRDLSSEEIKDMYDSVANIPDNGICGNEEIWPYNDCLELYWSMDMFEPSGAPPGTLLVEDKSGNKHHSQYFGLEIVDGVSGKALHLGAELTQFLSTTTIFNSKEFTYLEEEDYTWSAWIKRDDLSDGTLFNQADTLDRMYRIWIEDNLAVFEFDRQSIPSTLSLGKDWVHIAAVKRTVDESDAKISLFVNGILQDSEIVSLARTDDHLTFGSLEESGPRE